MIENPGRIKWHRTFVYDVSAISIARISIVPLLRLTPPRFRLFCQLLHHSIIRGIFHRLFVFSIVCLSFLYHYWSFPLSVRVFLYLFVFPVVFRSLLSVFRFCHLLVFFHDLSVFSIICLFSPLLLDFSTVCSSFTSSIRLFLFIIGLFHCVYHLYVSYLSIFSFISPICFYFCHPFVLSIVCLYFPRSVCVLHYSLFVAIFWFNW